MVLIPAGEYLRGRSHVWKDYDVKWYPRTHQDETPARKIYVDAFFMDEHEVTNEQYASFVKATRHRTPYHWVKGHIHEGKGKHPVVNVSWDDAVAFCQWESKRLPTEAEWERACRGIAEGKMFPWGDEPANPKLAHYSSPTTAPVCEKVKNAFGLCDIVGNVWEWNSDWYERTYYEKAPEKNPPGAASGVYRVLRGGSWFDEPPLFLTCSYRSWARQAERSPTVGFRCVKSIRAMRAAH
jgi:formylglycine-generating enzyme required for sulfatase activity